VEISACCLTGSWQADWLALLFGLQAIHKQYNTYTIQYSTDTEKSEAGGNGQLNFRSFASRSAWWRTCIGTRGNNSPGAWWGPRQDIFQYICTSIQYISIVSDIDSSLVAELSPSESSRPVGRREKVKGKGIEGLYRKRNLQTSKATPKSQAQRTSLFTFGLDSAGEILYHCPCVWMDVAPFKVPLQGLF